MTWQGARFIDHHTHLLRWAAGEEMPCAADIADFHRRLAAEGSTPMDAEPGPLAPGLDLPAALATGLRHAASLGLAEVTEAGLVDWAYLDALLALRDRGPLPVRVRLLVASGLAERSTLRRTGDDSVEVIGVKFYADGWLGLRTCALCRPFADRPGDRGVLFLDAATLARRAAPFAEAGWTIATHAIGDRAIDAVLDAYDLIFGSDCPAAAPRIEHAQVLRPDLMARMAAMGVVACIQPCFASSDVPAVEAGLGDGWPSAYKWGDLLRAGAPVLAGSDFPIEPLDPEVGLAKLIEGPFDPLPEELALMLMTASEPVRMQT